MSDTEGLQKLLAVMRRLRDPQQGCPWDREQTFASLAPFAIEEAYEVADVIERQDLGHLCEELGDLLFQVVFQAQIAAESQLFDFNAVSDCIVQKLIRRHPHVFANAGAMSSEQQTASWESLKAAERLAEAPTASHIDGVPATLPALTRAIKISRRAARVGFDWPEASQTAHKVSEELDEVLQAASAVPSPERDAKIAEEVGDLLFAVANLARKFSVDAETALRAANRKFERRFRAMEALATQRGQRFEALDLAAQEALWQDVKRTADAAG